MSQVVPDKYKALQKEWKIKEQLWSTIHYGIGLAAALLAALMGLKGLCCTNRPVQRSSVGTGKLTA